MSGLTECARRRSVEEERGRVDHDMHLSLYASAAAAAGDVGAVRLKAAQCAPEVRESDGKIEEKHGNNETKDDM